MQSILATSTTVLYKTPSILVLFLTNIFFVIFGGWQIRFKNVLNMRVLYWHFLLNRMVKKTISSNYICCPRKMFVRHWNLISIIHCLFCSSVKSAIHRQCIRTGHGLCTEGLSTNKLGQWASSRWQWRIQLCGHFWHRVFFLGQLGHHLHYLVQQASLG